ncbi:MAG: protein-glutamate O-methyltransferase CheR [Planctomycetes bacterium]|nr:protein-glutamate O-methyltransferase CheR [Planctomycetota bacterium]
MPYISPASYRVVRDWVQAATGFSLGEDKEHYVGFRLTNLLKRHPGTGDELVARAMGDPSLQEEVVESILNHETSFFRDWAPFQALREELIPELIERRQSERTLRIWSAACSYGQEPYSLVLLLEEHFKERLGGWEVELLASDVSTEALDRARLARYSRYEVNRGLPGALLLKYFDSHEREFEFKASYRERVCFERINLLGPWPPSPLFDVILVRNVLIYFDIEEKIRVLERMRRALRPDGFLLLGSPETTLLLDSQWIPRHVAGSVVYVLDE